MTGQLGIYSLSIGVGPPSLSTRRVLQHLADLWGYDLVLREVEADGEAVRQQYAVSPRQAFL